MRRGVLLLLVLVLTRDGYCQTAPLPANTETSGALVFECKADDGLLAVRFSPSGTLLMTVAERDVRLWDCATGRAVGPAFHDDELIDASFTGGGYLFLAGRGIVWDVKASKQVHGPFADGKSSWALAISPDCKRVAVVDRVGEGSNVRICTVQTGRTSSVSHHHTIVDVAVFSPDGRCLATGETKGGDEQLFQLWDCATGVQIGADIIADGGKVDPAFSPDGRRFVVANLHGFSSYDTATGRSLHVGQHRREDDVLPMFGSFVKSVAITKDSKNVVVWKSDEIATFEIDSGLKKSAIARAVSSPLVSPNGHEVATGRVEGGALRILDLKSGRVIQQMPKGEWCGEFSPDGRRIATYDTSGRVYVWTVGE